MQKSVYILFIMAFVPLLVCSQQITLTTPLQSSLKETSGLIYINQKLITHNDSGGDPVLYEVDSITGSITREVLISNGTNIDWEDLCIDDTYIYIADIGNNSGTRRDLKIYRILISEYVSTEDDAISADIIHFSYADQTDFSSNQSLTNFDAEALISYNDSLYIFTKNRGDFRTNIYALPKTPGSYQIEKIDSINSEGLVTGATFNQLFDVILLSGYAVGYYPFVLEISNFSIKKLSTATTKRYLLKIPSGYSLQVEAVSWVNNNQYYFTSEESVTGEQGLFKLDLDIPQGISQIDIKIPVISQDTTYDVLNIYYDDFSFVEIYDCKGVLIKNSSIKNINISDVSTGVYIVVIKNSAGYMILSEKMMIR